MNKKVILFCGVESTGKSTATNIVSNILGSKGYNVQIISEVGRDICEESGGVFEMSLLDYERILYLHQSNFLKAYASDNIDVILLDTDSVYTRYFLEKDESLMQKDSAWANKLIELSEIIAKNNFFDNKISKIIYCNPDCPFVQDGTRTYEQTRNRDSEILLELYKKIYGKENINIVAGKEYSDRIKQIESYLNIL